jgi:flavin reductase (DIM6/NTAB) family NADH-FMN oxidoreductase RutF
MRLKEEEFYRVLVRPTVVISTISKNGIPNVAPFSFTSPISIKPPLFGFSCNPEHDTWRNIEENGEFVANLVGEDFGPLMHILEQDFPYEVSEIEKAHLTEMKSIKIRSPRIKEAFGWLECKMERHFQIADHIWIVGKVLVSEIKDDYMEVVINVERAKPLNHIYGEYFVTEMKKRKFNRA